MSMRVCLSECLSVLCSIESPDLFDRVTRLVPRKRRLPSYTQRATRSARSPWRSDSRCIPGTCLAVGGIPANELACHPGGWLTTSRRKVSVFHQSASALTVLTVHKQMSRQSPTLRRSTYSSCPMLTYCSAAQAIKSPPVLLTATRSSWPMERSIANLHQRLELTVVMTNCFYRGFLWQLTPIDC